jgi:hypothetical protein
MVVLLISLAMSACSAVPDGRKPLEFELRDNAVIVSVTIGQQGQFRFLLDTGASRSVITSQLAARLGTTIVSRRLVVTPAGQSVRPVAGVTLALGDRPPVGVTATIVDDDELLRGGVVVDGILGQDVLAPLVYTIDYRRRLIFWDALSTAPPAARLPLEFDEGRALVTLSGRSDASPPLRLIPDSGADSLVLFARSGRQLPTLTPLDVGLLRTLSGQQLVRKVMLHRLQVGAVDLQEHAAVVMAEGNHPFPPGDGLLPLHLFSRVTFNGPAGYLTVSR